MTSDVKERRGTREWLGIRVSISHLVREPWAMISNSKERYRYALKKCGSILGSRGEFSWETLMLQIWRIKGLSLAGEENRLGSRRLAGTRGPEAAENVTDYRFSEYSPTDRVNSGLVTFIGFILCNCTSNVLLFPRWIDMKTLSLFFMHF